jgi:hypothetical protein
VNDAGDRLPEAPGVGAAPDTLLAVDAGIRAGFALYARDGRLRWYRSRNYGTISRLKRAAYGLVQEIEGLARIVVEGGGPAAEPWVREGARREIPVHQVQAGSWRSALMLARNRRTGADAKEQADTLARRVIDWAGANRPTSLRHDAAEAILVGLWAVVELGWLDEVPAEVRKG